MKESISKYAIEKAAAEHGFAVYASPWEYGIKADAQNGSSDFWLLPDYTDYLRTDRATGRHDPKLRQSSVLRARNRLTGDAAFLISSDLGVIPLDNVTGIETMGWALDFARLTLQDRESCLEN